MQNLLKNKKPVGLKKGKGNHSDNFSGVLKILVGIAVLENLYISLYFLGGFQCGIFAVI